MPVVDRADLLPPDRAGVRFVHAASGVGLARVVEAASGEMLVEALSFGDASVNMNIEPGTYDFSFMIDDAGVSSSLVLDEGSVYTIILAGDASVQQVVTVIDTP
jgi:hypothetical protein